MPRQRLPGIVPRHKTFCLPRLSNGSEWLFHGKDEVSTGGLTLMRLPMGWVETEQSETHPSLPGPRRAVYL